MDSIKQCSITDASIKIKFLTKELLTQKQCNKTLIWDYLYELNKSNHRLLLATENSAIMLLVNQLCAWVQPTEARLIKATSEYLTSLIKSGANFQDQTLMNYKRWLLETLEYSESDSQIDILIALHTLFSTNALSSFSQDLRKLLGENALLWRFLYCSSPYNDEKSFYTLCCLEAIINNKEKNQVTVSTEYLVQIKDAVLRVLLSLSFENNEKYFNKNVCLCIRILRIIATEKAVINSIDNIGKILGVIQAFLFYGIKDYPPIVPQQLYPTAMNLPDNSYSFSRTKGSKTHKTKYKKQLPSKSVTDSKTNLSLNSKIIPKFSSDSDTSDTEVAASATFIESKIRLETMQLFYNIVLNIPSREFFGYWTQIVASGLQTNARVLTRLILKDPSYKVRQIAWITITELLRGARIILQHAEDIEQTSFITVFALLSSVIKELHYTVSLSLNSEQNIAVLTHTLKCASALAESTPYHRLKFGLASELIKSCRIFAVHKDPTIRVAALGVFEALASSEPVTLEILNCLAISADIDTFKSLSLNSSEIKNAKEKEELQTDSHKNLRDSDIRNMKYTKVSWILEICLKNISNEASSVPVRLQSLKLLGVLANNIENLIYSHLVTITETLVTVTKESSPQIVLHACRVIEIMAGYLMKNKDDSVSILFWNIICEPVVTLLQHSEVILKEVACNCIGNIGSNVFSQLTRENSILIITLLFGATRERESAVRAAGLRTLGLLVTLSSLEEDSGFLMDLAEITCSTLQDVNLGVRIKAAWALASLCDCLIRRENNSELEALPLDVLLRKIYESSVKAAKDDDKVKCNATRAIGSILYLCRKSHILGDTSLGLESLIECATVSNDQKVRWNACRAIGLVLSREPDCILPASWKDQVFPTLSKLVCESLNFKVRTNAAWSISVCRSYGKHIVSLWKSVILGLENSQHVPNYVDYTHRDSLVQQLCLTLSHLAVYTNIEDLLPLWTEIRDHIEDVLIYMKQFQNHVLPEKADDLITAQLKFSKYELEGSTELEREIAKQLKNLFVQ